MQGGNCGSGAVSAGFAEFAGPKLLTGNIVADTAVHATLGGVGALAAGGKFANGALTGAFGYLFNCGLHPGTCLSGKAKDSFFSGDRFHSYEELSFICNMNQAGCTREAIFDRLREFPTPGNPIQGGVNTNDVTSFGGWKIRHVVDSSNFAVFNITEPGQHGFDPGYVYRNVQVDSQANVYIQTYGEGSGGYRGLNLAFTRGGGWQAVDSRISSPFSRRR